MKQRIVFMGSPDFSVPTLQALVENFHVVGVVTQPDRRAGRGKVLKPPPVKVLTQSHRIEFIQPSNLRKDPQAIGKIKEWRPNIIIVIAYGQILPLEILQIPAQGCLNVHASLLPRWRGVSPINAAILNGDQETGVTIMQMDQGIDTGPVIDQQSVPITKTTTAGELFDQLAKLGASLLVETIPRFLDDTLRPIPQPDKSPTLYAPMLKKSDGKLNYEQSADKLERMVRAYHPWPGTFTIWKDKLLKIHIADVVKGRKGEIGEFIIVQDYPAVQTSENILVFKKLQPPGKKPMAGDVFLRGARDWRK